MAADQETEYRRVLKRFIVQGAVIYPLGSIIGFLAFALAYGSLTDGFYGIPFGALIGSTFLAFLSRFGRGPHSPKWNDYRKSYRGSRSAR